MNIELLKEILVLVGPVLASIAATVSAIAVIFRLLKNDRNKTVAERVADNKRMMQVIEQQQKDTAIIKAKVTSLEEHVGEMEKKIK